VERAECVYHPRFKLKSVAAVKPISEIRSHTGSGRMSALSPTDVLTADEEREIFFRFNLYRYRVMKVLRVYRGKRLDRRGVRELLRWEKAAAAARDRIVSANTSLVLAMVRRARNSIVEISELISEGNLALLRCADKFDFARGFKFSTYACRAILASFSRAAAKQARYRLAFPATFDPAMERSDFVEQRRERTEVESLDDLKQILRQNSADLSAVERRVLTARFALDSVPDETGQFRGKTLEQVGDLLGVSKERVRQIQNQALDKLRGVLEKQLLAAS
jgi:RNA polymerase sigma factor (sigma-70 family)